MATKTLNRFCMSFLLNWFNRKITRKTIDHTENNQLSSWLDTVSWKIIIFFQWKIGKTSKPHERSFVWIVRNPWHPLSTKCGRLLWTSPNRQFLEYFFYVCLLHRREFNWIMKRLSICDGGVPQAKPLLTFSNWKRL